MITLEQFVWRALAVPFKLKGRDWNGWDCWGMFRAAYSEVLGVELPAFDAYQTVRPVDSLAEYIQTNLKGMERWQPVAAGDIQQMDGLILRRNGRSAHIALVVDRRRYLHTEIGVNTVVSATTEADWPNCLVGAYRLCR